MFTQPEQYVFNYTDGEIILDWAESQNKKVRCHNLIWASELSEFVTSGNWTSAQLTQIMKEHIYNVVAYFGDRCYSWDVVNEALNDQNGGFSSNVWYNTIGSEYFYQAFQFANEVKEANNLTVKLYYNDYNIESPGTKTTAAYGLVKNLTARGIKIDGVGLESHFIVGETPSLADQTTTKNGFLALGVDVAITELDIRFAQAPFYNVTGQAQQATDYYNSVKSCMAVGDGCIGVVVWDFDDYYSWVPGTFAGQGGADIYNDTLQRKPAYYACAEALAGLDCQSCSTSFQSLS
jgi:endo-1,4-beta-xylanase